MGDMEIMQTPEARTWQCNCPYYHEAHTWQVVTRGLSVKIITFFCKGTEPN